MSFRGVIAFAVFFIYIFLAVTLLPKFIGYATYDVQSTPGNISSCQDLNVSGEYILQNNVSASGTCFNIQANNVTLNGQGYTINYSTVSAGYGINNIGYHNITIKNTKIEQNGTRGSGIDGAYAVYFEGAVGGNITNNTIRTNGLGTSYGIYLLTTNSSIVNNNTILTSGSSSLNYGIRISSVANNNLILNNNITTNGTNGNYGIYVLLSSIGNNITGNTIRTSGTSSDNYGIWIRASSNNTLVTGNNVITDGTSGNIGIFLMTSPRDNNISGNTISTNGTFDNYGIMLRSDTKNSVFSNNNITTNGNDSATTTNYGIFVRSSSNNTFISNKINNTLGEAIHMEDFLGSFSLNNNFTNILIVNGNLSFLDLNISTTGVNYTYFIDSRIRNYSIGNSSGGGIVYFKNSTAGEVKFLQTINGSGDSLNNDIQISNNSIFINASKSGLNKSANLTFYNLPTSITNVELLLDGNVCNSASVPSCFNLTALNAGNLSFNVTQGGAYSVNYTIVNAPVESATTSNSASSTGGGSLLQNISEKIYEFSKEQLRTGINVIITKNDKIIVYAVEKHEISFTLINASSILLVIKSEPINVTLSIGQSAKIDADKDAREDFVITLLNITNNKPALFIKQVIDESLPASVKAQNTSFESGEAPKTEEEKASLSPVKKILLLFQLSAIILVIIMIAIVVYLIYEDMLKH